jgi:hypothetical protein
MEIKNKFSFISRLMCFHFLLFVLSEKSVATTTFCDSVYNSQTFITSRNDQQIEFTNRLQKIMDRTKLPVFKSKLLSILPRSTRSVSVNPDKIDYALWEVTKHLGTEVGRVEIQNKKGETLGLTLVSTGETDAIQGRAVSKAILKVLAQAWANNEYFNISKLIVSHSHPFIPGTLNFSGADHVASLAHKQIMEFLGLTDADYEAHLLGVSVSPLSLGFGKKGMVIPSTTTLLDWYPGVYMDAQEAAAMLARIVSISKSINDGQISKEEMLFEMPDREVRTFKYFYHQ